MDGENEIYLMNSVSLNFDPDVITATTEWAYYSTLIGASFGMFCCFLFFQFLPNICSNCCFYSTVDFYFFCHQELDISSNDDLFKKS
jgi:hypothetical protein